MITWLMSNYFSTIPKELEEAAVIEALEDLRVPEDHPSDLVSDHSFSGADHIFKYMESVFQIPLILASWIETKPVAIVVSEF